MAGRWFRFDADFFDHHKALQVSLAARGLFVASIGYCWRHETDGWIPAAAIRRLADDPRVDHQALTDELLAAGLWERDGSDYRVHDYLDHQPSSAQRTKERDDARERQQKSRARRAGQPESSVTHNPVDGHTPVTRDSHSGHNPSQRKKTVEDVTGRDVTEASGGHAPAGAGAADSSEPDTAQTLTAEHVAACKARPPERVIGQTAIEVRRLLDEGVDPAHVRAGLELLRTRARHPSTLPGLVNEILNPPAPRDNRPVHVTSAGAPRCEHGQHARLCDRCHPGRGVPPPAPLREALRPSAPPGSA